jgi:hypothetical protein
LYAERTRSAAATRHYHAIPATTRPADLLCSHISINFDRTGLQEDWNVAFPIDRLRDLTAEGTIGSMAISNIRSWARPIPCRWNRMSANSPAA